MIFSLLFLQISNAQNFNSSYSLWNLSKLSGDLDFESFYRANETTRKQAYLFQKSTKFLGGIRLNTSSFFLHPDFIIVKLNGEYRPESGKEQYLSIPNKAELRTLRKLDLSTTFFKKKAVNISTFLNFNESYNNRENLTNIKSDGKRYGVSVSYRNKFLPISINYNESYLQQIEVGTSRLFMSERSNLRSKLSKTFTKLDKHELSYSLNNYLRQNYDLLPVENIVEDISLRNNIYFDKAKKYNFSSQIIQSIQRGNNTYKRLQANESLVLKLPKHFSLNSNYRFLNIEQKSQKSSQNYANLALSHKLYLSLNTRFSFEYSKINHTSYDELNRKSGIDISYTKKIPTGKLSLTYRYNRHYQNNEAQDIFINEINEEYYLEDGQIVTLNRPYIEMSSIIVTDYSGTTIYQLDFDYILIERAYYIEIQRLPGGQIPNNETVYIDYTALQISSYQYDAAYNMLSARILLFKNLIEFFYTISSVDYINLINTDNLSLNKFDRNVLGAKVDFGIFRLGFEFDKYNSNIIPYQMYRAYLLAQKSFYNKVVFSLNGNIRNYEKTVENIPQQFADVSGKLAYKLGSNTRISVDASYRYQHGDGIELDLLTSRAELATVYAKMTMKIGADIYIRDHLDEKINFNSFYFKLIRNFNL